MSELDPKRHAAMRSNVAPAYSLSNMLKSEYFIDRSVTLLERRLDESLEKGQPFELGRWLHFFTWDMVGEIHFSSPFGFLHQGRDVGNTMKNGFKLAFYITSMGYMQWLHSFLLGNPILRWLDFQPNEHALNTSVLAIEKRKKNPEARVDMMQHWMDQHAKHPDRMTEKDITCAVLVAVGAGGDTVGSVLQAIFYLLLKEDPSHLEHLRQEIDASGTISPVVSYAEAQKMPYLQAVIKESQRIYPGVAWNLPRVVPKEGFTVAGRHFTQGTILSVNPWLIHRNKDCFGPDAGTYNPARWLGDPVKVKEMNKFLSPVRPPQNAFPIPLRVNADRYIWVQFGLGYNACIGRNLASLVLNKITATLIRDFDISLDDQTCEWKYHELFIAPQSGWPVRMKRRNRR